ncbi:nitrogen regulation protein NR(II) [Paraburkholderia sp. DHOC27]|uniref:two-component system sensor histidine kinase NtrB n=1 Tax=Paraburkholderia sp. DHOC27 TaxID=2303330 RepID=UPI000E3C74A0|nr:PAS domain-containing hybrid sensor histidine kinase/response regulator [Paraburkholderia sp. DHOC27]RFU44509.1 PAS domain S-box protein [Paraburkholderia sp. DHOC27]
MNLPESVACLSREMLIEADLTHVISDVNSGCGHVLGWSQTEFREKNFLDLVHPDDRGLTLAALAAIDKGGKALAFINRCMHKSGEPAWVSWRVAKVDMSVFFIGRDISAERRANAALEKFEEALFQLDRTATMSQLANEISHDFNNQLQSVVASLELIRRLVSSNRGPETERFITNALSASQRAATLNHQVRQLLRPQSPNPQVLAVNQMLVAAQEMLLIGLPPKIKVDLTLAPDLWEIYCDRVQAETAVLNLLLNASEAMAGGGTIKIQSDNIEVSAATSGPPSRLPLGPYVMIVVKDSGAGMPAEIKDRAFETFFTTKPNGLGLGLSVVQRFAQQNGGQAFIQSEPGQGAAVTIYLPRFAQG